MKRWLASEVAAVVGPLNAVALTSTAASNRATCNPVTFASDSPKVRSSGDDIYPVTNGVPCNNSQRQTVFKHK